MRLLLAASALMLAACSGGGDGGETPDDAEAPPAPAVDAAEPAIVNEAEAEGEPKAEARAERQRAGLPDYDTDRLCRVLGGTRPNAAEITAECHREEAQAREALAARPAAPAEHRAECERLAGFSGGSYEFYAACLDATAAAQPPADEAGNEAETKQ